MSDLHQFIERITDESHLRVEQDLGDGFVRLRTAEAERRQAKHDIRRSEDIVIEMLRNSRDAHAQNIFVACWKDGNIRNISIIDDGDGIPESMHEKVFEARVTSKLDTMCMDIWGVHGRGMALYAIRENAKTASVMASSVDGGTSIHVESDTSKLSERRDQSTLPVFTSGKDGVITVTGPKNINRTVIEFAYIEASCRVWLGSPSEIAASLWVYGKQNLPKDTLVFCHDPSELPVPFRLSIASSPDEFACIANDLGLPMSSRTARRIMNGQLQPAIYINPDSFNPSNNIDRVKPENESHTCDYVSDLTALEEKGKLIPSDDDLERFRNNISLAFSELCDSYYLDGGVRPEIRVNKGKLVISIPLIVAQE